MLCSSPPILPEPGRTDPYEPATKLTMSKALLILRTWLHKGSRCVIKLQLSHSGGKYSIERLVALHEYTQNTSLFPVLLVCLSTPLPMILLVLSQEVIPLRDPADGWRANYGIWIRMGVLGAAVTYDMLVHISYMMESVELSTKHVVLTSVAVRLTYAISAVGISTAWTFPIPFMGISLWMVIVTSIAVWFRVFIGSHTLQQIIAQRRRLVRYVLFFLVQILMAVIYPLYQFLFEVMQGTPYELPVICLLPMIKFVMKNVLARTITHIPDLIPEAVIYTVEFFNALYGVSCIQKATSATAVVLIMTIDLSQSAIDLYEVHHATKNNLVRLKLVLGIDNIGDGLVSAARPLCERFRRNYKETCTDVRVRSSIAYSCRPRFDLMENIPRVLSDAVCSQSFVRTVGRTESIRKIGYHRSAATIHPGDDGILASLCTKKTTPLTIREYAILLEALDVLFTAECVILDEYLETVIPLLYGSFILIAFHLPNAPYHIELVGVTADNVWGTVKGVFFYGSSWSHSYWWSI